MQHFCLSLRSRRGSANVPMLLWRVRANDQEVGAGMVAAMAGSSRQYSNIACVDLDLVTVFAAEHQAGASCGEAKDFMGC